MRPPPGGPEGWCSASSLTAARGDRPAGIRIRFSGRLGPPALAEITEVDPPSDETLPCRVRAHAGTLRVDGPGGPVAVEVRLRTGVGPGRVEGDGHSVRGIGWSVLRRAMPTAVAWIDWPGDADELELDISCRFEAGVPAMPAWLRSSPLAPGGDRVDESRSMPRPLPVPARLLPRLGRMHRRAASYARGCTALVVSGSERTILTDHRILPLSWTRDAYWQARLLLATWARGGSGVDERIVADHLRWLFLRCERPDGRWVRSHHADGRRKDHPLQADQQLYPLLELADHLRATGSLPALPPDAAWADLAAPAWRAAEAAIDDATGLIRTDENPADDVPAYPYLLSDQVLLWHTATRLAGVSAQVGLDRSRLLDTARRVRDAVGEHFAVPGPLGPMLAYSVDGRGGFERYMDANDLPAALAPLWGFCRPTDVRWATTMRFAFGPHNPSWARGPLGGLGSRHTPGTWTLGDLMGWVAFGLMGERTASEAALERLARVAFPDGMLPEAYDPGGSGDAVRHWFAWPGAALGALLLDHGAQDVVGRQELGFRPVQVRPGERT